MTSENTLVKNTNKLLPFVVVMYVNKLKDATLTLNNLNLIIVPLLRTSTSKHIAQMYLPI